jgi:hypothetical protein
MTLDTAAPVIRFDDLELSRCVFAGDVVAHIGHEVTLYLVHDLELSVIGTYGTPAAALAALDIFDVRG